MPHIGVRGSHKLNKFMEVEGMQKQTIEFAVVKADNVVTQVGRTSILQPRTNFKGGTIKWYEDKPKQENK